ncbi:MAG: DNA double-strand break repair nuclease NurA [Chloroflexi bacterium]|nr:DNA double-strand break repair nuclease NurA [Chloroflexota bacterium]
MTLEFEKVVPQVERMGRALAAQNLDDTQRTLAAWEFFLTLGDLDAIWTRIKLARERDAGFRGAAPLYEAINQAYPLPSAPARATILAADGSQIYPNAHGSALFYLTNIGVFVFHHGVDELPEQITEPRLHYSPTELHDSEGHLIANEAVNARRNVGEIEVLARESWRRHEIPAPLLAVRDGPLLFWVGKDVPDGKELQDRYLGVMVWLLDTHAAMVREHGHAASLVGYVDRPTSAFVVSLLHLLSLEASEVRRTALDTNGVLEGLVDQFLMFKLLKPGERSALLVQQSPQNKRYHDKGESYEIAFFYLNVGSSGDYHLARVEMPMWVARVPERVDEVHALIYHQCQVMWRYPYALTRADELAVVRSHERSQLNELIEIELRRNQQQVEHSEKLESKVVRHGRTTYSQKHK